MRFVLASALVVGLSLGITGCGEKSSVEETKEIKTPDGTTTIKNTSEVKETGNNPPPATAEPAAPAK